MTQKTALMTVALVLVLGATVSSCSREETTPGGAPDTSESSPGTTGADDPTPDATSTPTATETASEPPEEPKPTVGEVGVLISNSEWDPTTGMTVRGYANTVDDEAVCTLELTLGATVRTVESDALVSATTMSCGELTVGPADLAPGDWQAVLSYESTTAFGTSTPVVVTVP